MAGTREAVFREPRRPKRPGRRFRAVPLAVERLAWLLALPVILALWVRLPRWQLLVRWVLVLCPASASLYVMAAWFR